MSREAHADIAILVWESRDREGISGGLYFVKDWTDCRVCVDKTWSVDNRSEDLRRTHFHVIWLSKFPHSSVTFRCLIFNIMRIPRIASNHNYEGAKLKLIE